jgi:hypothetical protein
MFIDNLNNYPIVNHKDGKKLNNIIDNLEWATHSQNTVHAYKTGLMKYNDSSKKIKQIDLNTNEIIKIWDSVSEVRNHLGVSSEKLRKYIKNMLEINGFIWKYDTNDTNQFDNEIWKTIEDYNYEISNYGRVRNIKNRRILKQVNREYKCLNLSKNSKHKQFDIHKLVAIAFVKNPNNYPIVNHINGSKHDNRAENLEWTTSSYNSRHAYEIGKTKHYSIKINQYSLEGQMIKQWDGIKEAYTSLGIEKYKMFANLDKNRETGGYIWKRAE